MKKRSPGRFPIIGFIAVSLLFMLPVENAFAGGPSYDVPLGNPVYQYLDMLALPPRVGDVSLSSRPYTEAQVCSLLVYAANHRLCRDTAINAFYLKQVTRIGDDGQRVAPPHPGTVTLDGVNSYVYPYFSTAMAVQDSNFSVPGFTPWGADSIRKHRELYNTSSAGFRLYSMFGGLATYVDGSIITQYSSLHEWLKTNNPDSGESYSEILSKRGEPSHLMGSDDFTAYMKIPVGGGFDVKIGNDRVSWGYDDSSGMLFSGVGKPFLQVKIDKSFGKLNYTFVIGKLIGDTYEENRVIYAKHMTFTPSSWLSFGLSDAVLTVDREFVPLYCMPFLPFYFSEHYLGDLDNRIMSLDFQSRLGPRCAAYGEMVVDDMQDLLGFVKNDDFGDKWGGLFGIKVYNPLPWLPLSLFRAEVLQIEPWVYTTSARPDQTDRNFPVNFGSLLGNQLGPHSRQLLLELSGRFSTVFGGGLSVRRIWKGEGPGSGIFDTYNSSPTFTDTLSDGTVLTPADLESKSYRFAHFDRDRTVFSATFFADASSWLRFNANLSLAHELEPSTVNLYQAGAGLQFNY